MRGLAALIVLGTTACNLRPPHVVLEVRDPGGVAAGATALDVFDRRSGARTTKSLVGKSFPLTVTLATVSTGTKVVAVEVHTNGEVRAVGSAEIIFGDSTGTARIDLYAPCATNADCRRLHTATSTATCHESACLVSTCGDGVVTEPNEDCEDGNDNPNDECDRCASTRWDVDVVVGFGDGGAQPLATVLGNPFHLAMDRDGDLYVVDNHTLLKLDAESGLVVRVAPGLLSRWGSRLGRLAVDGLENVFIIDGFKVMRIDGHTGRVSTVVGGQPGFGGDGGPAAGARLDSPSDVAVDGRGNLYIADAANHRIRRIDVATQTIETYAGDGGALELGNGGHPLHAALGRPLALAFVPGTGALLVRTASVLWEIAADGSRIDLLMTDIPTEDHGRHMGWPLLAPLDAHRIVLRVGLTLVEWDRRTSRSLHLATGTNDELDVWVGAESLDFTPAASIVAGPDGSLVYSEPWAGRVRRMSPPDANGNRTVAMIIGAGRDARPGHDDIATATAIDHISQIAVDDANRIFMVENTPHGRIHMFDPIRDRVTHIAGTVGEGASFGDGGAASLALLSEPWGLALGRGGQVYVGALGVRAIDLGSGDIRTAHASPFHLTAMTEHPDGRLLAVAPSQDRVFAIDPATGAREVFLGGGSYAPPAGRLAVRLQQPLDVAVAPDGAIYVAEAEADRVVRLDPTTDDVSVVIGAGAPPGPGPVPRDQPLPTPYAVAADDTGALYVVEYDSSRLLILEPSGQVREIAGPRSSVPLIEARDVEIGPGGEVYFAANGEVHRVDPATAELVQLVGHRDPAGDGPLGSARLDGPIGIAAYAGGWLVADPGSTRMRFCDRRAGVLRTVLGVEDGPSLDGTSAREFSNVADLHSVTVDPATQLAYTTNRRGSVLQVDFGPGGVTRIDARVAGLDPMDVRSQLTRPTGIVFDTKSQRLFVADAARHTVRAFAPSRLAEGIELIAGQPDVRGNHGDTGRATDALLNAPGAVAVGPDGSVYIADTGNHRVRRVIDGRIEAVLGDGTPASSGVGSPARSFAVDAPLGLAVDPHGNLFVTSRTAVRRVSAGRDGIATGEDRVDTIYGAQRRRVPESQTSCLAGIAVDPDDDATLAVVDTCQGLLLELRRKTD